MKQPNLKDLRTTLNVLSTLDVEVPQELLTCLSEKIRQKESSKLSRRMNRMTEEELIQFEARKRVTLRINLPDGRLIQRKTNELTFEAALMEMGYDLLASVDYPIRRKPFILHDATKQRKRIPNYKFVMPGIFIYRKSTAEDKKALLDYIDCTYRLDWDIDIV